MEFTGKLSVDRLLEPPWSAAYFDVGRLLTERALRFEPVGSCLISGTAPNDLDVLVLIKGKEAGEFEQVDQLGHIAATFHEFEPCVGEYDASDDPWMALRSGMVNLIVTTCPEWYDRALAAQHVCVALNLRDKLVRRVVWRIVRDGMDPSAAINTLEAL